MIKSKVSLGVAVVALAVLLATGSTWKQRVQAQRGQALSQPKTTAKATKATVQQNAAQQKTSPSLPSASVRAARLATLPSAPEGVPLSPPLRAGDPAPDFVLPDQTGKRHRLRDLRGKTVVLSFYPQDFTMMCASQAVSFTDALPQFHARDAVVFGVSVQPVESKTRFAQSFGITYPLLADPERSVARAYRVLNQFGTAARVTFIIGPDGRILFTDQSVHARTHARDVLTRLDRLQATRLQATPPVVFLPR